MNTALRQDADTIIASSLKAVLPDAAVRRALESKSLLLSERQPGRWHIWLSPHWGM